VCPAAVIQGESCPHSHPSTHPPWLLGGRLHALYPATSLRSRTYIAAIVRVQRGVEALAAAAGLGSYRYSHCAPRLVLHARTVPKAQDRPCALPLRLCDPRRDKVSEADLHHPSRHRAIALYYSLLRAPGLTRPRLSCRVPGLCDSPQAPPRLLIVIRQLNTQPPRSSTPDLRPPHRQFFTPHCANHRDSPPRSGGYTP
jgi:hypothetical protein